MKSVYDKIEKVLEVAKKSLAPHEFALVHGFHLGAEAEGCANALRWIGCSESTLGRRMREMVVLGRLTSKKREGKTFKEFAIAVKAPAQEPVCPI